jgi:large subunit ribosomal protein L18
MKPIKLNLKRQARSKRVRAKIHGSKDKPRLHVYRSSVHTYAQIINDDTGRTLVSASEVELKAKAKTKSEKARLLGELIAQKAKDKKIIAVRFDRGAYKYQGRVKAFAEAARIGGLKF